MDLSISKLNSNINYARIHRSTKRFKPPSVLNSQTTSSGGGKQWLKDTVAFFSTFDGSYRPQVKIIAKLHNEIFALFQQRIPVPIPKLQSLIQGYDGLIKDMESHIQTIDTLLESNPQEVQVTQGDLQSFQSAGVQIGDYRSGQGKKQEDMLIGTRVLIEQLNDMHSELGSNLEIFSQSVEFIRKQMPNP